jgi:hypothetical protein
MSASPHLGASPPTKGATIWARARLLAVRWEPDLSFGGKMSIGTILLIILVIALLGGFSGLGGGPFYGTGYYGGGGIGLILVIVVILVVLGKL